MAYDKIMTGHTDGELQDGYEVKLPEHAGQRSIHLSWRAADRAEGGMACLYDLANDAWYRPEMVMGNLPPFIKL
jgi:hypothetical protein